MMKDNNISLLFGGDVASDRDRTFVDGIRKSGIAQNKEKTRKISVPLPSETDYNQITRHI